MRALWSRRGVWSEQQQRFEVLDGLGFRQFSEQSSKVRIRFQAVGAYGGDETVERRTRFRALHGIREKPIAPPKSKRPNRIFGKVGTYGTVFKLTPAGKLTTLHSFCAKTNSLGYCTDGSTPGALVQGTDGDLYGTTYSGGNGNNGTVFKITPSGKLKTLYSFCAQPSCADGADPSPFAGLIQATGGDFFGTTIEGGEYADGTYGGTIFKITPGGELTVLHSFCAQPSCADGSNPLAAVVQGTDGDFYGTTSQGGATANYGTVFKLSTGEGPFVITVPTFTSVGWDVTILGTNLTGATRVTFNGTAATITAVSATSIKTTVPTGATTGFVEVTTPSGTLKSNAVFTVTP